MKSIIFRTLITSFAFVNLLNGQEKKTIEFVDFGVEWFHEPWVDTLSIYDQDYSLVRDVIIEDDFFIAVYTQFLPSPFGFLVERINLNNGQIDWSYNDFSEKQYTRSVVQNFQLIADTLELYLLEESEVTFNPIYPRWDSCFVACLKLNVNTGDVLEYIGTDHGDTLNTILEKDFFISHTQIISTNDSGFNILKTEEKFRDDSIRFEDYISLNLNNNGHFVNSDTTTLEFPSFRTTTNQNYPLNANSFISHVESPFFATLDLKYFSSMIVMDNDLQSFDSIQLHNNFKHDSIVYIGVLFYDEEKFLIETAGPYRIEFDYKQKYFLFDYKGNLINKHENSFDAEARGEVILPYAYDEDNRILGIGEYQDFAKDSLTHLFFWRTNDSNGIDTLLDFKLKDKDIQVFPLKAFVTHDNDLIVYYNYRQPSFPSEHGPNLISPNWYFWLKIDGDKLGLKTSVQEIGNKNQAFEILPNPAFNTIELKFENPIEGMIDLLDQNGKRMSSISHTLSDKSRIIDVSELASGVYVISVKTKDNNMITQQFIKI